MTSRGNICLIEDDPFVRRALSMGLDDQGYTVLAAPSAAAGLEIVRQGGVAAIVTDLNMPGTSGAQLIAEARAQWPDMPIVAISGDAIVGGSPLEDVARDFGADAALSKPFRASKLADLLDALISARQTRR